nr:hypothetical protein [uncultured Anaerotignum sp.]
MEDKSDRLQEYSDKKQENSDKKQDRKASFVTRRDFYGCVIILLIAIFLQGMQTRALIRRGNTQLENNMANRISNVESRIGNIPNSIETALLEADNPFRESSMEIVAADLKAKKVTLRMTAMPKEWKTGDTSLQFYLSCDGGEKIAVDAAAGADHSFTAEKEIPFCETAAVTAILQRGDTEYPFALGETSVAGAVYPFFSGDFYSTFTWTGGGSEASVSGNVEVEVQLSDWMMQEDKSLTLKNPTVEIYVDGKRIQKHKMQAEVADTNFTHYTYTIEKAFHVKSGQYMETYFKAEDENGLNYTYLVDRSHVTNGDVQTEEMAVEAVDSVQDGRLKVE